MLAKKKAKFLLFIDGLESAFHVYRLAKKKAEFLHFIDGLENSSPETQCESLISIF